jgi:hypothetical protein
MFSRHDASAPPTAFATSRARVFALERTPRAVQTRLTSRATRFVGIARRERAEKCGRGTNASDVTFQDRAGRRRARRTSREETDIGRR